MSYTKAESDEVRAHHKSEDCESNRPDDPTASADASEQSDQVIEKNEAAMLGLNSILHRLNNV
jgi:hypothetical protein